MTVQELSKLPTGTWIRLLRCYVERYLRDIHSDTSIEEIWPALERRARRSWPGQRQRFQVYLTGSINQTVSLWYCLGMSRSQSHDSRIRWLVRHDLRAGGAFLEALAPGEQRDLF